jgi:hypothetical protein
MNSGGGGSSQPTQQTSQQTSIPSYVQPYVENVLGRTAALTDINQNPYQPYQGQQVAGASPLQQQSYIDAAKLQLPGGFASGTALAEAGGKGSLSTAPIALDYGQKGFQYGAQGTKYGEIGAGYGEMAAGAGQNYANQATDPRTIQRYMSPYMQNVVDWQKQQAVRDYQIQAPQMAAQSVGYGAFGGNRLALQQSEANRGLQNRLAGIEATGQQQAFDKAQQAQQFGAGLNLQGLQGGMQGAGVGLAGLGAAMQGSQVGLQGVSGAQQGYAGATTAGGTLGNIAAQQNAARIANLQLQNQFGLQQQALNQAQLNVPYQQYQENLNYPYKQLAFQQGMFSGLPMSQSAQTMYQQQPNTGQQALAWGLGGLGAYKAFGQQN